MDFSDIDQLKDAMYDELKEQKDLEKNTLEYVDHLKRKSFYDEKFALLMHNLKADNVKKLAENIIADFDARRKIILNKSLNEKNCDKILS